MTTPHLRWRWGNVPVPEPYVGGLLAGGALHALRPWQLTLGWPFQWATGGTLLLVGFMVVAWSVRTVGPQSIEELSKLVTGGPYRYSRNPMYVGWTGLYVGVALVATTAWPLVLFPWVALAVRRTVHREERVLERTFGEDYRAYRRAVRPYL